MYKVFWKRKKSSRPLTTLRIYIIEEYFNFRWSKSNVFNFGFGKTRIRQCDFYIAVLPVCQTQMLTNQFSQRDVPSLSHQVYIMEAGRSRHQVRTTSRQTTPCKWLSSISKDIFYMIIICILILKRAAKTLMFLLGFLPCLPSWVLKKPKHHVWQRYTSLSFPGLLASHNVPPRRFQPDPAAGFRWQGAPQPLPSWREENK